jgi:hypothetical protein
MKTCVLPGFAWWLVNSLYAATAGAQKENPKHDREKWSLSEYAACAVGRADDYD